MKDWKRVLLGGGALAVVLAGVVLAEGNGLGPHETSPPNRWGYGYPHNLDAEISAPLVHRIRYKDDHAWLMEVSNPPGFVMEQHGHPYPSVFARDSAGPPAGGNLSAGARYLDPDSPKNGQNWRDGPGPGGAQYPQCTSADPQAPHNPSNQGEWPLHFFRIEFLRVDQDDTNAMRHRYGKVAAVKKLYETDEMRFVEVTVPVGQTLPTHTEAYPSVLAFDSVDSFNALATLSGPSAGKSDPPLGQIAPRCLTTPAGTTPAIVNRGELPIHFYRFDFKRVGKNGEGEAIKDNWRKWYPYMLEMKGVKPQ